MAAPTNAEIEDALREAALAPRKAANASGSVEEHSLTEQIALDRYLASKSAVAQPNRGLRRSRLIPPGTV